MKRIGLLLSASVFLFTAASTPAQAETVNCNVINYLPYTITAQGVYCLTGNLSTGITSGNAITINANNVVLDLNGFKIGGLSAGPGTTAIGIYALERQNITIKNGTVRGFFTGVHLDDYYPHATSQGHLIENIRADLNTVIGIHVGGKGNTIRNNAVVATGGSTSFPDRSVIGIAAGGSGAQVLDNMVTGVAAQGTNSATGINLGIPDGVVAGNRISDITAQVVGEWEIQAWGICVAASNSVIITDNHLSSMTYGIGIWTSTGVVVSNNNITGMTYGVVYDIYTSDGPYMNNLVWSNGARYTGGTAYTE